MIQFPPGGLGGAGSGMAKHSLLGDLGKPTMRGIRKCPKCGVYNGTRGLSCKNKSCDMVFKEAGENKKKTTDACKLYTGTSVQIFSVRLRDKGPDYRGFVQLPTVEGLDPHEALEGEAALLVQSASQCFVDSCSRSHVAHLNQSGQSMDVLDSSGGCGHIASCLSCPTEANPVTLRHSAMNDLNIRTEFKHEVYSIAEQIVGPLVQRVSKNIFAVKCEPDSRHPLGYLHMAFMDQKTRDTSSVEHRFFCTCDTFRGVGEGRDNPISLQWSEEDRLREPEWMLKRCIHFYSCVCAFASDEKLAEEFRYYIQLDCELHARSEAAQAGLTDNQVIAILGQDENGDTVQVEVLGQDELHALTAGGEAQAGMDPGSILGGHAQDQIQIEMETPDGTVQTITVPASRLAGQTANSTSNKRRKKDNEDKMGKKGGESSGVLVPGLDKVNEVSVTHTFHEWMASVTERINQTMHYQFDGHPEPLVFHAPQVFFECLRERISAGSRKKRLPNSTTAFVRKDALPLGTFTKYTWSISNILHVKQIFDTPHMPLEVTRLFVENKDGTYSLHTVQETENEQFNKIPGKQKIRAHELKTFLKVGQTSPDQKDLTPFIIEWIPDILPLMKIGELRIKFEYGHQRNGQLERKLFIPCIDAAPDGLY